MSEGLTPEEQKAIDELSEAVASEIAEGKSKEIIVRELVKQDWPEDAATQFVNNIEQAINDYKESPEGRKVLADKYARHMIYGILWAVGGTVVTVATYTAASNGGTYFVAWGAIVFGIIDFFRGWYGWITCSSSVNNYHAERVATQRICSQCGHPYILSDYQDDVEHIFCSECQAELPSR